MKNRILLAFAILLSAGALVWAGAENIQGLLFPGDGSVRLPNSATASTQVGYGSIYSDSGGDLWWKEHGKAAVQLNSAGVTAHAALTGLVAPADDHTQYLLIDATRGMSAATLITNMNADLLDGVSGTGYQTASASLTQIAALDSSDSNFIVGSAGGFVAEAPGDARTSLGLGSIATQAASNVAISGGSVTGIADLAVADGGTGSSNAGDARTALGLGTIATQAANSVTISGGSITGITDLAVADGGTGSSTAGDARTALGLGTIATQAANNVSISGGSVTGITDILVADGGTGSSNAGDARTALGVAIGSDVQAWSALLDGVAAVTSLASGGLYWYDGELLQHLPVGGDGEALLVSDTKLGWGSAGVTAHSGLSGLVAPADDHTQYLLADGTRGVSADWDIGSFKLTAQQVESDIANGTTPLIVASQTVVANLNVSFLGGNAASAFLQNIVEDLSPQIGGADLDFNGFDADLATGSVLWGPSYGVNTAGIAPVTTGFVAAAMQAIDGGTGTADFYARHFVLQEGGGVGQCGIYLDGDPNTGFLLNGADQIYAIAAGAIKFQVQSSQVAFSTKCDFGGSYHQSFVTFGEAHTTDDTLGYLDAGELHFISGASADRTLTMPAAIIGASLTVGTEDAEDLAIIKAATGDVLKAGSVASAAAGTFSSDTPGSRITFRSFDGTTWQADAAPVGSWSVDGVSVGIGAYGSMRVSTPATTTLTGATPAKAAGTTTEGPVHTFVMVANNRLKYLGAVTQDVMIAGTISVKNIDGGAETLFVSLYQDDAEIAGTEMERTLAANNDVGSVSASAIVSMATGSYVELWFQTAGNDVSWEDGFITARALGRY